MPCAWASPTARLDGAPTAARIGNPAASAFWTSSKLARPLTKRRWSADREGPFPGEADFGLPTSLSTALCRPTSSRTHERGVQSAAKKSGGVDAAGLVEDGTACSRNAAGRPVDRRRHRTRVHPRRIRASSVEVERGDGGLAANPAA